VEKKTGMFVRNATGLVRELSPFDALNMVFAAILFPVGITQAMNFGTSSFPGANIPVACIIGGIFLLGYAAVYAFFTIAMPRSGGDYVWVSRSLSPLLGFVVNLTLTFVFVNWVSLNFTWTMNLFVPAAGSIFGWPAAVSDWFVNRENTLLVSTVLTALFAFLMIRNVRFVAKFMKWLFAVVWIGMAVWFIGLIITPHSVFIQNLVNATQADPEKLISLANQTSPTLSGAGIGMTLLVILWVFQNLSGVQFVGYFSGELKTIRKTVMTSVFGGLLLSALLFSVAGFLVYKTVGRDLFSSLSVLGVLAPDKLPSNVPYLLPSLTQFLTLPGFLKGFVAIAFLLSIIWWTPVGYMLTRNFFAWSFDHLAPQWISDINPKLHTPVKATIVMAVFIEVLNILNLYAGLGAYLINMIAIMALAFIIVCLAAIVFPYRRRDLFDNAPDIVRKKVFGVPWMVVGGVVGVISWCFILVAAFLVPAFGMQITPLAMIEAFTVPVIGVVWYLIAVAVRKKQGVDFKQMYTELPPE
jgi:amino acid transporter